MQGIRYYMTYLIFDLQCHCTNVVTREFLITNFIDVDSKVYNNAVCLLTYWLHWEKKNTLSVILCSNSVKKELKFKLRWMSYFIFRINILFVWNPNQDYESVQIPNISSKLHCFLHVCLLHELISYSNTIAVNSIILPVILQYVSISHSA